MTSKSSHEGLAFDGAHPYCTEMTAGIPHPMCRPPKSKCGWRVLRGKRWHRDDGQPAHVVLDFDDDKDEAYVWIANCDCANYAACPLSIALARAADIGFGSTSVIRRPAVAPTIAPRARKKSPRRGTTRKAKRKK